MLEPNFKIAYIGTCLSYFTRKFLPALQIPNSQLTFICVLQNEFSIIPSKSSGFLKLLLQLKKLRDYCSEFSIKMYWSIY